MFRRSSAPMCVALAIALSACNSSADHATDVAAKPAGHAPASAHAGSPTPPSWNPFPDPTTDSEPAADSSVAAPAETKTDPLQDFTLTMARVDAYMAANRNLALLAQQDPALGDIAAMDSSKEGAAQYSARIDQHPEAVSAISAAGLSPREFALTGEALVTGMMTESALESGALKQIPTGVNPQLVEFVRDNKAALNAKWKSPQSSP